MDSDCNEKEYLDNTSVHRPQPSLYSCQGSRHGTGLEEAAYKGISQRKHLSSFFRSSPLQYSLIGVPWPPELPELHHRILKCVVPAQRQAAEYLDVMKECLTLAVPPFNLENRP